MTAKSGDYWTYTFADNVTSVNFLLNNGTNQTGNITDVTEDTHYWYDGNSSFGWVAYAKFINNEGWNKVCGYVYGDGDGNNSGWPGDEITATDGVYTFEKNVNFKPTTIIWNNGSGNQTVNLTYTYGYQYELNSYTVNYVNKSDWSSVYAYTFSAQRLGAWSGTAMNKVDALQIDGHDVYSLTSRWYNAEEQPTNIIFNNGNSGDDNQTIDLTFTNGKTYNIGKKSSDTEETTTGTINATLSSTGMSTFSSPFALDFSNAITGLDGAYVVSSLSASSATLTSVEEVPANTGLILKGTANASISIPYKASAAAPAANKLSATSAAPVTVADNEAYILYDGEFHPTNAGEIPMFKAYLKASDVPTLARSLSLVFDDESTGINEVKSAASVAEGYYNLAGQRIAQPTKGLYIVNGKKVIIK